MFLDNIISIFAYIVRQKRIPNLFSAKSLTEKVLLIKMRSNGGLSELRKLVSDRLKVRAYIEKKSRDCNLIPLLWSGTNLTKDVWASLPAKFVIKANHGSKMVKIVDKKFHDFNTVSKEVHDWLQVDYYRKGREWVYKEADRVLVIESYLAFEGHVPPDYKFFCINGSVGFIQVDLDRFNGHKRNIYDTSFKLLPVKYNLDIGDDIPKPKMFNKALNIAEELSKDFDFIRVDLYLLEDQIYFGELTNFPGNCLESFEPHSFDIEMGNRLEIKR